MTKKRLFLIDAHALCYRAYFAVQNLRTSDGQPTNAVFGFANTLKKIIKDFSPDYLAACFDTGKKTHRQEKFAQYKVHRPSMPDDLISQIPLIKELILAYKIPIFELEGFEADDVIATIAKNVSADQAEVIIVSGDKDMVQLVNGHVKIFDYRKAEIIDAQGVRERYGFEPEQIVDFIALAGDQTDNIPGVSGIGKVTATQLIHDHGSLENIFKNIADLKSQKLVEKLINQKEQALMSQDLARLDARVPIDFDLETVRLLDPNSAQLRQFFERLEFRRFADEISGPLTKADARLDFKKHIIKNTAELKALCEKIQKKKYFAFSVDNVTQQESLAASSDLALAFSENESFCVRPEHIAAMKPVFSDEAIVKVCHDIKGHLQILAEKGILIKGKIFDVMLAGYILESSQIVKDLSALTFKYLQHSLAPDSGLSEQVVLIMKLFEVMRLELQEKSLIKLFEEIEIPLAIVLYRMQEQGVCLDIPFLKKLSEGAEKEINSLTKKLYQIAGEEFNLNSPKQLSQILFVKMKLPVVKKTKTGFSTDEGVLERLALKHEFPALLLDYRQLMKLKTTYIDALPKLVDSTTKRIHAVFDQAGTETGRLSSRNPNLQNIPIRTELGRQIRKAFIASDKKHLMVSADYSQIELRILAHLSQDKNLIKAFREDQDIHSFTARQIFDVKDSHLTSDMRVAAKRVNFGIVYGMSAFGLSKDLKVSQKEAQEFIDKYFLRYPGVLTYMQTQIEHAEKNGFVLTLLNRRRYIPEIHSENLSIRQFAQRKAINTPVQGTAADLIKMAMIGVQDKMDAQALRSQMTITVHDELVFDVVTDEQETMQGLIKKEMESPLTLDVPIKVTMKAGQNWLEMTEVKL